MNGSAAIVVIGYNRPRSIKRLLDSLARADYQGVRTTLVISIDNCGDRSVLDVAEAFEWRHGEKVVNFHEERLGLRRHVLSVGDLTDTYDSVIVLEDDLYVSEAFYTYACSALQHYGNDTDCAGVSLYNHRINVHNMLPFEPVSDGSDVYYLQMASSWGVAWNSAQWNRFRVWTCCNEGYDFEHSPLPPKIKNWKDSSWLKLFAAYLFETNRYFVYPRESLATNFSDPGTHVDQGSTCFQVPLAVRPQGEYRFSKLKGSNARYDAYFESCAIPELLGLDGESVVCDLYGSGRDTSRADYLLISGQSDRGSLIRGYAQALKPHDANILASLEGHELSLVDLRSGGSAGQASNSYRRAIYYLPYGTFGLLAKLYWGRIMEGLGQRLRRFF